MKIYLGYDSEMKKRYLSLKEGEANHMFLLGKSGYGKTTFMKALAEEIFDAYRRAGRPVLIIIIERKYDVTKFKYLKTWLELFDAGEIVMSDEDYERYKGYINYIRKYTQAVERNHVSLGLSGDFAMGLPALSFQMVKWTDGRTSLLSAHGLKPRAYPVTRIVFKPSRDLKYILLDNGPLTEVHEGKISYNWLDFETLKSFVYINSSTNYARILQNLIDTNGIKDPDKILAVAEQMRAQMTGKMKYDKTMENIAMVVKELKENRLFTKNRNEEFFRFLSTDRINIIDFSLNSSITPREEELIFSAIVDYALARFANGQKIPVYFFIDEVQELLFRSNKSAEAIDRIYRVGRSLNVTLIASTQYLHALPKSLVYGASHLVVVGQLASRKDKQLLKDLTVQARKIKTRHKDFDKSKEKFRGWFVEEKEIVHRMYFRPATSY